MCKKIQFRFPQTYIEGLQGNMRHFVIDSLHDGSKAFFCSETERQKKRQIQIPLQLLVSEDYTTAFLPSTSICTVYDFQHLTHGTNTKFRRHVFNFFFFNYFVLFIIDISKNKPIGCRPNLITDVHYHTPVICCVVLIGCFFCK